MFRSSRIVNNISKLDIMILIHSIFCREPNLIGSIPVCSGPQVKQVMRILYLQMFT